LHLPVLLRVDVVDQHMDFAAVLGKIGGHLLADEGPGQVGDFQTAVDGVVVGDGHPIHASLPGNLIELQGLGVAFMAA